MTGERGEQAWQTTTADGASFQAGHRLLRRWAWRLKRGLEWSPRYRARVQRHDRLGGVVHEYILAA